MGFANLRFFLFQGKDYFEYAGGAGGWIDTLGYTFARGRIFDSYEKDCGQFNDNSPIFWASGACMFIRSSLFKKLNGFYEYYFMYCEEVDFCWRAHTEGYKVVSCGQSIIYHKETERLLDQSPTRIYYLFRNNLIMLHRNLPTSSALGTIPARLVLNMISLIYFIGKGHIRISLRTVAAHFHYFKWVISGQEVPVKKKRKPLSKMTPVYKGSIVYQYYLLRKNKFSDIVKH